VHAWHGMVDVAGVCYMVISVLVVVWGIVDICMDGWYRDLEIGISSHSAHACIPSPASHKWWVGGIYRRVYR